MAAKKESILWGRFMHANKVTNIYILLHTTSTEIVGTVNKAKLNPLISSKFYNNYFR